MTIFQEDRLDPMIYIFPRMTKCTFHKFGTSGEVEKHDALCILPLNIGKANNIRNRKTDYLSVLEIKYKITEIKCDLQMKKGQSLGGVTIYYLNIVKVFTQKSFSYVFRSMFSSFMPSLSASLHV